MGGDPLTAKARDRGGGPSQCKTLSFLAQTPPEDPQTGLGEHYRRECRLPVGRVQTFGGFRCTLRVSVLDVVQTVIHEDPCIKTTTLGTPRVMAQASAWDDRFDNHALWASAERLRVLLAQAETIEDVPAPGLERCELLQSLLVTRRKAPEKRLISATSLSRAQVAVDHICENLNYFVTSPGVYASYVNAADSRVDEALDALALWPNFSSRAVNSMLSEALAAREEYQGLREELAAEAEAATIARESDVERTKNQIDEAYGGLLEKIAASEQHLSNIGQQTSLLHDKLTAEDFRIDALVTGQTSAFTEESLRRSQSFEQEALTRRQEHESLIRTSREAASAFNNEQLADAVEVMDELRAQLAKSSEIVGATAERTITTDFGQRADAEAKSAQNWNKVTVASAVVGAGWLIYFVVSHPGNVEVSWSTVVYKLGVTIALLGLAAYAGAQSSEHRREERDTKRIQLVLNAMGPFLATLNAQEGNDLKLKIAKQAFAARPSPVRHRRKLGKADVVDVLDMLEQAKSLLAVKGKIE